MKSYTVRLEDGRRIRTVADPFCWPIDPFTFWVPAVSHQTHPDSPTISSFNKGFLCVGKVVTFYDLETSTHTQLLMNIMLLNTIRKLRERLVELAPNFFHQP